MNTNAPSIIATLTLSFSACGSDRSLMLAPSPTPLRSVGQQFAASIRSTPAASATTLADFARCLQGSLVEPACFSGARVRAQATVGTAAIAAPSNLVASATGSSVTLTWVAPTGIAVASYIIEAGSSPGLTNLANFSTGNAQTSFSTTGVGAGNYYVRVRAIGVTGEISATSNEALLVVGSGPCTGAPGAPFGLSTVSVSGSTLVLAWNGAAGGPTSYVVEAGSGPGQVNLANSDLGLTTSLTATGVGVGTYYVRIRAKNPCGSGPASNEIVLVVGSSAPGPRTTFGTGQYLIGRDIAPGRYYTVPAYGCYWERQSGLGGSLSEILANDFIGFNAAQWIVDILASDLAFKTQSPCGTWSTSPRYGAQGNISPGLWLVGTQISPGTYRAAAQYGCYWARVRNFTGNLSGIIANDFVSGAGPQLVAISGGDVGFETDADCGTWTRVSALVTESTAYTAAQSPDEIERNLVIKRSQHEDLTNRIR